MRHTLYLISFAGFLALPSWSMAQSAEADVSVEADAGVTNKEGLLRLADQVIEDLEKMRDQIDQMIRDSIEVKNDPKHQECLKIQFGRATALAAEVRAERDEIQTGENIAVEENYFAIAQKRGDKILADAEQCIGSEVFDTAPASYLEIDENAKQASANASLANEAPAPIGSIGEPGSNGNNGQSSGVFISVLPPASPAR